MKLQKLCYYSQAWALVWDEHPLFDDCFEAWVNGPVSPALYEWHKGMFLVNLNDDLLKHTDKKSPLTDVQKETIDSVLDTYGKFTAQELSDLTHKEDPWKKTNEQYPASYHYNAVITHAMMHEYYSSIPA
nr:MAG TPA: hypothetical protein [Caudoviricetes sp.]